MKLQLRETEYLVVERMVLSWFGCLFILKAWVCRGVMRRGDRVFIDSTLGQGPQWAAQCSRWSLEAQSVQNTGTNSSVAGGLV